MGNQRKPDLTKRCGIWHLDKQFRGVRIRESARTSSVTEAIALLANRIDGVRQSQLYGVRTNRTFREAARKYLEMNKQKKSISDDENHSYCALPMHANRILFPPRSRNYYFVSCRAICDAWRCTRSIPEAAKRKYVA